MGALEGGGGGGGPPMLLVEFKKLHCPLVTILEILLSIFNMGHFFFK